MGNQLVAAFTCNRLPKEKKRHLLQTVIEICCHSKEEWLFLLCYILTKTQTFECKLLDSVAVGTGPIASVL